MKTLDRICKSFAVTLIALTSFAHAQNPQQTGVTVQLPTQSIFRIDTVVGVPDGGSMVLGGVNSFGSSSISRGTPGLSGIPGANRLFRNQGIGNEINSSGARAHVQILIREELEADVLAQARQMQSVQSLINLNGSPEVRAQADFLTRHMGGSANRGPNGFGYSSNSPVPGSDGYHAETTGQNYAPGYPSQSNSISGRIFDMPQASRSPVPTNNNDQFFPARPRPQTDGYRPPNFNGTRFNNRR